MALGSGCAQAQHSHSQPNNPPFPTPFPIPLHPSWNSITIPPSLPSCQPRGTFGIFRGEPVMEEVQSRFQHLLQPIRDLTQNWEVDVAAQLGEYLEELDQISISFDGGKTTMNFTEAALLIQGSACVYSRKVEHLYNLVYQALDHISKKKREKLPTSLRPDGRDADAIFPEEQDEFLSLDDIPEVSPASVTLRSDQQPAAVKLLPLIPMCLVPPDETERRENPLLSRRGEVLASRKDFRMNTCVPHASGAFLLEPSGLQPSLPGTAPGAPGSAEQPSSGAGVAPVRALSFSEEPGGDDDNDNDDNDNDIPGAMEDDMEVAVTPKEHIEAQRSVPQSRGYILRERPASQDPKPHSKEVTDPWQCLDPFTETEEKPFKKGRPFTVPPELADQVGGKRRRTDHRELQDFTSWYSETYDNYIPEGRRRRRGPTFADLEDLYWQHFKERQEVLRKLQKRGESPRDLGWQEQQREDECEEGADDDMEHEDVEPEALEELGEGGAPDPPEPDYEELVRRNVELFMASSEKYAQETELSQRIRLWEEKMESLLQEQESRVPFDVRAYGEALAGRCGTLGQWHSLASLVAGQPPFEVCRYVLATLQLANDKVVELAQDAGLEVAVDTARLRLLSTRLAHERFHNYQLPSQKDPKDPK